MSFNVGEKKITPPENKHDNLEENNHEWRCTLYFLVKISFDGSI